MQHRRRNEVIGGSDRVPPIIPSLWVGIYKPSSMAGLCTCGAPGGWYGHERHCGEVEPVPVGVVPFWNHISTDAEDLEF